MARIGIYGGTFNPPHVGHMAAAKHSISALGLDRLLLIPDRIAPHKVIPSGTATAEERLAMVRLAAAGIDKCDVSDMELLREGPS
jgi:nicotinate-nucleotide adenylyltransferase